MGENKKTRSRMEAEIRVIDTHLRKIEVELGKQYPDRFLIAKWENDIARHMNELEKYRRKLPGKKKGK